MEAGGDSEEGDGYVVTLGAPVQQNDNASESEEDNLPAKKKARHLKTVVGGDLEDEEALALRLLAGAT